MEKELTHLRVKKGILIVMNDNYSFSTHSERVVENKFIRLCSFL